jgi:membrane-bound lytic murein transglycosylase A|tara:strand:- start:4132 stop:5208 length:1077 start_codon:yes stop_codon:yes gene_type:complete
MMHNLKKHFKRISFKEINGWDHDSHIEAYEALKRGIIFQYRHSPKSKKISSLLDKIHNSKNPKYFFEQNYIPYKFFDYDKITSLFTGYYEPYLEASHTRSEEYYIPLYAPPKNLIKCENIKIKSNMITGYTHLLQIDNKFIIPPTREMINNFTLEKTDVLAWLKDPIEAYFMHIQGSGKLIFTDGTSKRFTYAAKNGFPYTSIGKVLVSLGFIEEQEISMDAIKNWFKNNSNKMNDILNKNKSYIFFKQHVNENNDYHAIGQTGIELTPERSLAVDLSIYDINTPIWLETITPSKKISCIEKFQRLMIAQDTGSAIKGFIRGDIFFGSGYDAGQIAGKMKEKGNIIIFLLKDEVDFYG